MERYDFSGWATKNNLRCSDGRTIMKNAFANCDGITVPLVWNHQHNDPSNVLGHALLENRPEGVYTYGFFNDTLSGIDAKKAVRHGDINALSIWANHLKQDDDRNVLHGSIKEVSLVLAGANPGAFIDDIIEHGEVSKNSAIIYTGEENYLFNLENNDGSEKKEPGIVNHGSALNLEHSEKEEEVTTPENQNEEKTIGDVIDSMTEEQKNVMYALISQALEKNNSENAQHSDYEGDDVMKHNLFSDQEEADEVLTHADMTAIFADAKRCGSLKDAVLQHGIEDIDWLFPDVKNLNTPPEFIKRDTGWVGTVMNGVHHTPFSRIKSMFADITADEARAKGYVKGNLKLEEVFTLLKRTTTPTTIYKKQKLDRDDIIDITDFDVVAWLKAEMRGMLDEEIARAILIGDGRSGASNDKINENNIRPIYSDEELFTIKKDVEVASTDSDDAKAKKMIRAAIKARKDYRGSGNPTLFCTEDALIDMRLIEDTIGHTLYKSDEEIKSALRVSNIVTVPVMENITRTPTGSDTRERRLLGIIINLSDYNVGADKGGAVNMFDDFDIDYNQQKYLIETRCSGALIKPYSAIVLEQVTAASAG